MTNSNPSARKQVAALEAAIKVLKDWRRRHYGPGHWAHESGVRELTFVEDGQKNWEKFTTHIQTLEDLIEIVTDEGVTRQPQQINLFGKEKT